MLRGTISSFSPQVTRMHLPPHARGFVGAPKSESLQTDHLTTSQLRKELTNDFKTQIADSALSQISELASCRHMGFTPAIVNPSKWKEVGDPLSEARSIRAAKNKDTKNGERAGVCSQSHMPRRTTLTR